MNNIYFIVPSFYAGGDEQTRFVIASGPREAVKLAAADIDDSERAFEPVLDRAKRHPEKHWRCFELHNSGKPGVMAWDEMPNTYWNDTLDGQQ